MNLLQFVQTYGAEWLSTNYADVVKVATKIQNAVKKHESMRCWTFIDASEYPTPETRYSVTISRTEDGAHVYVKVEVFQHFAILNGDVNTATIIYDDTCDAMEFRAAVETVAALTRYA